MNFKLFIESILGWENGQLTSQSTDVRIFIDNKRISIDNVSPHSAETRKILKALLAKDSRYIDFALDMDGYKTDVRTFMGSAHERKLPRFLYHGTSVDAWKFIQVEGLKPRGDKDAVYGAHFSASLPDRVYLSGNVNNSVKFAARSASGNDGSKPLILQIDGNTLIKSKLMPDEDSKKQTWKDSLDFINSFAYLGVIPPNGIKPILVNKDGKWIDFSEIKDNPLDPLAKTYNKVLKTNKNGFYKL